MGRLGPLTSMALGRSPYDDVAMGEGEGDPHEPNRQYDDKGRIYNPETKQIIKNIIRAHNEVMQVIGVAEPENNGVNDAELALAREHQAYESETGMWLLNVGRSLGIFGIWGIHGTRQRILLYRPYSQVEFLKLFSFERSRHTYAQLLLAGVPPFLIMQAMHYTNASLKWAQQNLWLDAVLEYIRFHLHLFLTMQRVDLIPATSWLPDVKFFIPFSSSSPFLAPPPLDDLSVASVGSWISKLAVNLAPCAAFYACGRAWYYTHYTLWPYIHKRLPQPSRNQRLMRDWERQVAPSGQSWQTIPESPTLGAADREIRHRTPDQYIPTSNALEGQSNGEPGIPLGAIRRQSTFSSRGGDQDYGTDEEDAEMVNPTLISFDVDTSESTEQPAGIWSAELRPSYGGDGRQSQKDEPVYVVNPLTSLPSILAADILTNFAAYVINAPYEAMALRAVSRAFARNRGLPIGDMFDVGLFGSLTWRGVGNIISLEMIRLSISGVVWALTTIISQWLHVTDEEWKDIHKEKEAEWAAEDADQPSQ